MSSVLQIAFGAVVLAATLVQTFVCAVLWRLASSARTVQDQEQGRSAALNLRLDALESLLRTILPEPKAQRIVESSPSTAPVEVSKPVVRPLGTPRADSGESRFPSGPTLIAVPSLNASGSERAASDASAEMGRRFGAIWSLADSGASAEVIARALGQPVGQVELILGLRRPPNTIATTNTLDGGSDWISPSHREGEGS